VRANGNSLKNHGADELAEGMFQMAVETMQLPMDEKLKFEQGDSGNSFGSVVLYFYGDFDLRVFFADTKPPGLVLSTQRASPTLWNSSI
jgi:hypothetical protein